MLGTAIQERCGELEDLAHSVLKLLKNPWKDSMSLWIPILVQPLAECPCTCSLISPLQVGVGHICWKGCHAEQMEQHIWKDTDHGSYLRFHVKNFWGLYLRMISEILEGEGGICVKLICACLFHFCFVTMGGKYFFSYEMRELKFREVENKSSTTCWMCGLGLLFSLSLPVISLGYGSSLLTGWL